MEMTRGYAENEWSVVNIAEMFCEVWAIIIKKINTISSLLIYFASSFQSEVFFFLWNSDSPSFQGSCWKLHLSLLLFGSTQVMNSRVRASCFNNRESDNEICCITNFIRFLHGREEPSKFSLLLICGFLAQLVMAPNSIWEAQVWILSILKLFSGFFLQLLKFQLMHLQGSLLYLIFNLQVRWNIFLNQYKLMVCAWLLVGKGGEKVAALFRAIGAHYQDHFSFVILPGLCKNERDPDCKVGSLYPVSGIREVTFEGNYPKLIKKTSFSASQGKFCLAEFQ